MFQGTTMIYLFMIFHVNTQTHTRFMDEVVDLETSLFRQEVCPQKPRKTTSARVLEIIGYWSALS